MLYVACKRGLSRNFARFVLFRPIQKSSFNLLCVLDHGTFYQSVNPSTIWWSDGKLVGKEAGLTAQHGTLQWIEFYNFTSVSGWFSVFTLQQGAADAKIKVPPVVITKLLKGSSCKAWSRSMYSHTCYTYCQGFLPCYFLPFQSIHLHPPKTTTTTTTTTKKNNSPEFSCVGYG